MLGQGGFDLGFPAHQKNFAGLRELAQRLDGAGHRDLRRKIAPHGVQRDSHAASSLTSIRFFPA